MSQNKKIIHIIHANINGGIEVGALKAEKYFKDNLNYKVNFIFNLNDGVILKIKKSIKLYFILKKKINENTILISSLWISHIICFILKLSFAKFHWISFLHNTNYATIFNKFICTKLTLFSNDIIFDSFITAKSFLKNKKINRKNIVNFYFKDYKFIKSLDNKWHKRPYDFIIVARNIKQKGFFNLENFVQYNLSNYKKYFKLLIITNNILKDTNLKNIKDRFSDKCDIHFKLNLPNHKVISFLEKSKYYICLSIHEGFAITVAEALKSGCFILTTNVGEQRNYLYKKRKKLINYNNKINFAKIEKDAASEKNFKNSITFFNKKVNFYTDQIINFVSSNK